MTVRGSQFLLIGAFALVATSAGILDEAVALPPIEGEIAAEAEGVVVGEGVEGVEGAEAIIPELVLDETSAAIRDLVADAGGEGSFLDKRAAAAVAEFYAERDYSSAWLQDGAVTERLATIVARIASADIDGLDPSAYDLPTKGLINFAGSMPLFAAKADVMFSQAIAAYAREAYSGRIDPANISKNIGYKRKLPDLIEALKAIAASDDPVETLVSYNPPHREFAALREKLADLRGAGKPKKPIAVPSGLTLKLGVEDARVGFLRQRLNLPTNVDSPALFGEEMVDAVKAFQKSLGLQIDGVVGPKTIAALNADPVDPIPTILVNMEKWRWMPRELGELYVRVNVPDFTVNVINDGDIIHETRVVVGKPQNQTPIFSDEIEHIVVNPAWYVPTSIIQKEMYPEVLANPNALNKYEVFALSKGKYRRINPRRFNWRKIDARKIQVRQPPGNANALGRVKFMFPNEHAVYLHDTPSKSLFKKDYRAYSHGCVRVMNPMEFADSLLALEKERDAKYLEGLYGNSEKQVNLDRKIPVHVTYFTAWVDEAGELQTRGDLYGHDRKIAKRAETS